MVYIILFLIAIIFIAGVEPLAKKVKIPFILFLIVFGALFSKYGIYDFFGYLEDINSSVSEIVVLTKFSIEILFVIAGLSLSLTNIKRTIKKTVILSFVPVFVEWVILGLITYILLFNITSTTGIILTLPAILLVMGIFTMSSAPIVVPQVIEAKDMGKKNLILDQISFASVMDNFLLLPLFAVCFVAMQTMNTVDLTINMFEVMYTFFISILTIIGAYVIGYLYGYLVAIIFNKFDKYGGLTAMPTAIIIVLGSLIIINITGLLSGVLTLVCAFGIGIAFDSRAKTPEIKIKAHKVIGKIYFNFFMPLIFLYIGVNLRLDLLINLTNLLIIILLVVFACVVKGLVLSIYLKINKYNNDESKVARAIFTSKGIMLFYFMPFLTPIFTEFGLEQLISFMGILATVSVIITIPISTILTNRYIKKLEYKG